MWRVSVCDKSVYVEYVCESVCVVSLLCVMGLCL